MVVVLCLMEQDLNGILVKIRKGKSAHDCNPGYIICKYSISKTFLNYLTFYHTYLSYVYADDV